MQPIDNKPYTTTWSGTRIAEFRAAVLNNNETLVAQLGTCTWIDDVDCTEVKWAKTPNNRHSQLITMLKGIVCILKMYNEPKRDGLTKSSYSKLEALGWKTYCQLVKRVYRAQFSSSDNKKMAK